MQDANHQPGSERSQRAGGESGVPTLLPTAEYDVIHMDSIQLSRRLNISIKSLSRMRQNGTGPRFLRVGAKVVYRLEDVLAYERSRLYEAVGTPVSVGGDS